MSGVGIYSPRAENKAPEAPVSGSFARELNTSELEVTPSAQDKLAEIVAQSEDEIEGVRIYVGGGGCGGMSYGMTFTDEVNEYDTMLQFDTFKVLVDVVALNYLRGAQIDYVQEVGRERFVFNNVFAETGGSGTCGACGSSGGGCA